MSMMNSQFNSTFFTGNFLRIKVSRQKITNCFSCLLVASMALFSGEATAFNLRYANLSDGYSNCSYTDTSDTVATFKVTIKYKASVGNTGPFNFLSRGILLYSYNGNGILQSSAALASDMKLNGYSYQGAFAGVGYTMYYSNVVGSPWVNSQAMTADIEFTILKSRIAAWPAVGVRAGNFTDGDDVGETTGLAYIGPSTTGNCTVLVNPESPPPAVTPTVTMTAPDWDLGELPRGKETTVALPATKDQLCFSYEGSTAIANQKYLINATNTNGLSANGRYLLKSLEDSSQTVPYTLTLENSKDSVLLPNTQNRLFSLETGGKTCFTPTFKAQPDKAVKGGAYSDILTFTVVAKP